MTAGNHAVSQGRGYTSLFCVTSAYNKHSIVLISLSYQEFRRKPRELSGMSSRGKLVFTECLLCARNDHTVGTIRVLQKETETQQG